MQLPKKNSYSITSQREVIFCNLKKSLMLYAFIKMDQQKRKLDE